MAGNEYDHLVTTGKVPAGNEYDDLLNIERDAQKAGLQQSLFAASKADPAKHVKVLDLSQRTKLPAEVVERNFDEVSKKAAQVEPEYDTLIDKTPGLAKWLQSPDNATVGRDDIETLGKIERGTSIVYKNRPSPSITSFPSEIGRSATTGWNDLNASAWHLGAVYGLTSTRDAAEAVAEANRKAQGLRGKMPDYATEFMRVMDEEGKDVDRDFRRFTSSFDTYKKGFVTKALTDFAAGGGQTIGETLDMIRAAVVRPRGLSYTTVQSLAHSLPSLVTGAAGAKVGAVAGGAAGSVVPGVGTAIGAGAGAVGGFAAGSFVGAVPVEVGAWINESLQKRGFDITSADDIVRAYSDPKLMAEVKSEAERKGLTTAAVDAVFNAFAGRFAAGAKPGKAVSKAVRGTGDVAVQMTGETVSEAGGQLAAAKGDLSKVNVGEAVLEGISSLGHSVGETAIGTAIRATLPADPTQAAEVVAQKTDQAMLAQHDAQALAEVGQAVAELKNVKNVPGALKNLIEVATEGQEATSVYFQASDWDDFWIKQGRTPARVAEQILGDGGKAYYEAKSSGTQLEIPLADYIEKVAPTEHFQQLLPIARTKADGMTLKEAQSFLQELPGVMETIAKEATGAPAEAQKVDSATKVGTAITEQLKSAGFDPATAETYAQIFESRYRARGSRLGVDPMELFEKLGLKIERPDIATPVEGQVMEQGAIDTPEFKAWFGDSKVVDESGKPLVVYHGTTENFTEFKPTPGVRTGFLGSTKEATSPAFFFTASKEVANFFASNRADYKFNRPWLGKTMDVFLSIKNPIDLTKKNDSTINKLKKAGIDVYRKFGTRSVDYVKNEFASNLDASATDFWQLLDDPENVEKLKAAGYDGAVLVEGKRGLVGEDKRKSMGKSYAVFSPTQIKSASKNRGTFDQNDPNILHQPAYHGSAEEVLSSFKQADSLKELQARVPEAKTIFDSPEVLAARHATEGEETVNINTPERERLREDIADRIYNKNIENRQRDRKVFIVLGGPASGKGQIAKTLAAKFGAVDIDNDVAKTMLPEYGPRGEGAALVHKESSDIAEGLVLARALEQGDNIVLVKVGKNEKTMRTAIERFKMAGYEVSLALVTLDPEKAAPRALKRHFIDRAQGFVDPDYIINDVGLKPVAIYATLKSEVDSYATFDNDVPFGEVPKLIEQKGDFITAQDVSRSRERSLQRQSATTDTREGGEASPTEHQGVSLPQDARGRIRFGANRQFNIDLFKNADLSTFLHESGHLFLEEVRDDVAYLKGLDPATLTSQQTKALEDADAILRWLGVDSWQNLKPEHHEKFARGFEAYLMEGKAPTSTLRRAFAIFRAWLTAIYRQLRSLNVELTNEVRGVFDRLLASEDEIAAAQNEQNMAPLFSDPMAVGMSEKEAADYVVAIYDARRAAEESLSAKLMEDIKRAQNKWWKEQREKLRAEISEEVYKRPEYIALSVLQKGEFPNGTDFGGKVKLDRKAIVDLYGKARADLLKRPGEPHVTGKDGVTPDFAAELFGFSSGDEFLTAITYAPPREKLIDQLTDARMKELHGDLLTDVKLPAEAMKAVHNEKRAYLLRKELEILASENLGKLKGLIRKTTRRIPPIAAVRDQAEKIIADKRVRDINPFLYQRAEAQAARQAVEAVLAGDFEAAFEAKQRELMNHELYRAAVDARENIDGIVSYMARFSRTPIRERLGKAGQNYLEQIDSILERFDFRRSVSLVQVDRRKSLREFVDEQRALGVEPVIPDKLLDEAYRQHYKETTYEELVGIRDAAKNIEHLAKLKNQLLKAVKQRELDGAIDEAVASIEANSKGVRKRDFETRLPQDELARGVAGFFASHRKFASLVRAMDGYKDGGVLWELLTRPMNDAGNTEAVMNEKATKRLKEIFSAYSAKDIGFATPKLTDSMPSFATGLYKKEFLPEIGGSLSKMAQIMVALNWGNADNRQKLMEGRGWTEQQVTSVLRRLSEKDLKVVNELWEFVDTYWPETKAMSERVTGLSPEKIEPTPFEVNGVKMRGGYFPLKYDDRLEPKAYGHLAKEAAERAMRGATVRSTTKHGHREERVKGVRMPVRLDFGVVFEHVAEVIHDQTHYEYLIDTNKLLGDRRLQSAIIMHYGDHVYNELRDALQDVAAGDVPAIKEVEKAVNWLRSGTSIAAMAWNVTTTLLQPLGLTQSIVRVGPIWVAKGIGRWLGGAARMENAVKMIHAKSDFMRLRAKTQMREINEIRNKLRLRGQVLDAIENSYFWLISRGQMIADVPTWLGSYEKAISEMSKDPDIKPAEMEKRAVALADQAVLDSQGGGQIKDLAGIQKGHPFKKLWTNFYSFFNTTYNLTAESIGRTNFKSPTDIGRLAVDMLMLYSVPAVLGLMVKEALRGDEMDEDEWWKRVVNEQVSYLMGTVVLARELGGAVQGFRGYEGPAGTRFFSELAGLYKQAGQGEADEAFWRALNDTAGILLHYPSAQIDKSVRGFVAYQEDEARPTALILGPPRE